MARSCHNESVEVLASVLWSRDVADRQSMTFLILQFPHYHPKMYLISRLICNGSQIVHTDLGRNEVSRRDGLLTLSPTLVALVLSAEPFLAEMSIWVIP
jgi:hypothetical protein